MIPSEGGPVTMRKADLTEEQRRVLLNVVENSYLFDVLAENSAGADWPARLLDVPRLAGVVQDFISQGLATLYRDSGQQGVPPAEIPDEEAPAILGDQDNWWSLEGTRPITVAPTDKGLALYQGKDVAIEVR
jgi:hypothetical protein